MATAPIGYKNRINENGKKYIAVNEPIASLVRSAFEVISTGKFKIEQVWKQMKKKGLACSKHGFWVIIRNPVYCGKIFIPKYKEEEAHFVQGQHESIILESLFYEVQDILDGRKKSQRTQIAVDSNFPLRGFLNCPRCGRVLTASTSKGKYKYYSYYHCTSACGWRYRAEKANKVFVDELKKYIPSPAIGHLNRAILTEIYSSNAKNKRSDYKKISDRLDEINIMLSKARKKLITEELDAADYRQFRQESEEEMKSLELKLTALNNKPAPINKLLGQAFNKLSHLDILYTESSIVQKREIISSIFPEKLTFDGFDFRTLRINEAVRLIYSIGKGFSDIKKKDKRRLIANVPEGDPTGTKFELFM